VDVPVEVDHPTLQLLRQRALSGCKPGDRKDPFKLGLVIEGGGMRGCVSGGSLQVGRSQHVRMRLAAPVVARMHAMLFQLRHRGMIVDGQSACSPAAQPPVARVYCSRIHASTWCGLLTFFSFQALADLGLRDVFDAVYGSSAGAINATYFLSGEHCG
jgi:hypothetical protein